jgi:two-component system, OmpR family, sensor histidine kinase ChvG
MSLRFRLLLLGLATLVLPWAGCNYAREMEGSLREAERNSLLAVAGTMAASLQGRRDLLFREPAPAVSFDAEAAPPPPPPGPGPFDLRPVLLPGAPFLDGYVDEWPQDRSAWKSFSAGDRNVGILCGVFGPILFVQLDVHDSHVVFDAPGANPLDPTTFGDRIWLGFDTPEGTQRQLFIAAPGVGSFTARSIDTGQFGQKVAVDEPRVTGAWQLSPGGYRIELRLPLSMLGQHFGVLIDDRSQRGGEAVSFGTLRPTDLYATGRLIVASAQLTSYLGQFIQPGMRVLVTDTGGRLLARVDRLEGATELASEPGIVASLYRRLVDRNAEPRIIESTAAIGDREPGQVLGILKVAETEKRWLTLRDRALARMLNLTVTISVIAVIAILLFAARLAVRLSRLRAASETALTREGLVTTFPETEARDELGDMARGFATLLGRLNEYTSYLRTLAGKLAHEIRTPLTIVRSSLENLESEGIAPAAEVYLQRARQGTERLNAILLAMGAATRVEEAIGSAERMRFDLVPVVASAVESYRIAFPACQFATDIASGPLRLQGAPDLIVQMLDKLIDNAADFTPVGGTITVRLREDAQAAILEVDNPGPTLPPELQARLFESLWQSRPDGGGRLHLGLGLYIVRLIAEFHGGLPFVANLPDGSGARFGVRLPLG